MLGAAKGFGVVGFTGFRVSEVDNMGIGAGLAFLLVLLLMAVFLGPDTCLPHHDPVLHLAVISVLPVGCMIGEFAIAAKG